MEYLVLNFEEKHLIAILIYLKQVGGRSSRMGLYESVAKNDRMPKKLKILEALGLIVEDRDGVTKNIWIELTPKGYTVTDRFLELEALLSPAGGGELTAVRTTHCSLPSLQYQSQEGRE